MDFLMPSSIYGNVYLELKLNSSMNSVVYFVSYSVRWLATIFLCGFNIEYQCIRALKKQMSKVNNLMNWKDLKMLHKEINIFQMLALTRVLET